MSSVRGECFRLHTGHFLSRGLVAAYLGAGGGNAAMDSGPYKRSPGAYANGVTDSVGLSRRCWSFDGANDYIIITTSTTLYRSKPLTLMGWYNFTAAAAYKPILYSNYHSVGLGIRSDGGLYGVYYTGTTPAYWENLYVANGTAGVWYHGAMTVDADGLCTLYRNGLSADTHQTAGTEPSLGVVNFGGNTGNSHYWPGRLADCCLYNRALFPPEIAYAADVGRSDPLYGGWVIPQRRVFASAGAGAGPITYRAQILGAGFGPVIGA